MRPATWPRENPLADRLLVIDPRAASFEDARVASLPKLLEPGDLLVVNDAATLPGSLHGTSPDGSPLEVRLLGPQKDGTWSAVVFGSGDWRTKTEERAAPFGGPPGGAGAAAQTGTAPRRLVVGSTISFTDLGATVESVARESSRLVALRFDRDADALWSALYRLGRPVQYAYIDGPLALWQVQTHYASRPWAAELPSAGRPLTWDLLASLGRRGVRVAALTHAAGLSSTGDAALDALLPLPERFEIPDATVDTVRATKRAGGRVVAAGTTVVRALEGAARLHGGELVAGDGVTDLVIRRGFRPQIVDGLFTGLHERSATHFMLLQAFAPPTLLDRAYRHAERVGYLCHEFGDSNLILSSPAGELVT